MFACYTCTAVVYDRNDAFVSPTCRHQVCSLCKHYGDEGYCSTCSSAIKMRHNLDSLRTSVMEKYALSLQLEEEKEKTLKLNQSINSLTVKVNRLESDNAHHLSELVRLNTKVAEMNTVCALNTSEIFKYSNLYTSKSRECDRLVQHFNRSEGSLKRYITELKETISNKESSIRFLRNKLNKPKHESVFAEQISV